MKRQRSAALGLALVTLAACASRPDLQAAKEAMLRADREFSRVTGERGLEGFTSFLADDVATLRPDSPILKGKQAMAARWAPLLNDPTVRIEWHPLMAEVAASGDFGYTVGTYRITRGNSESPGSTVGSGKYVTIWRRQADGSWKVAFDSGVEDSHRPE